jgi:histidine ammonia-lyase
VLCACQALDLLAPLATSVPLGRVHARVRRDVPVLEADRPVAGDIDAISRLITSGALEAACGVEVA